MRLFRLFILLLICTPFSSITAQNNPQYTTTRAIRQNVPLTNSIQKAMQAGTRDFTGTPGKNYWQLEADYDINVSLNPGTSELSGSETITMHNNSPDDLNSIVLRLDHNIFRPNVPQGTSIPAEVTEGMVITKLVVNGEKIDLYARRSFRRRGTEATNSVSGLDRTVATINLANAIKAGTSAKIEIEWHTKLPGGEQGSGHRMTQRWQNRLYQPTQWYPRLAKYDDLRGWQRDIYLGPAEFFNNFGTFDVKINVPGGWLVSGTGVLQNPEEVLTATPLERLSKVLDGTGNMTIVGEDERGPGKATPQTPDLIWHYKADKVNDFAWATSADFIWEANRATIPGKGKVPIYMFYLPERAKFFEGAAEVTAHALEFYSKLWAPYPFPQMTLQDGPSAGMEYPMVINSNRGAADHETAHQWWPMMVGTNETRYGWMDEGFNQYMNILSAADKNNTEPRLDGLGQSYGFMSGSEDEATLMWSANYAGSGYGYQTYRKTPLMLSMLGGVVGDDAVIKAMKKYTAVWSFKHPSPWDYIFFMNKELGQDLGWFWYYWLWTTEAVNGSISEVKTNGNETAITIHQAGEMPSPIVLQIELENGPALKNNSQLQIVDKNTVIMTWPVDVWFDGYRDETVKVNLGGRAIKKITLDPHGRFPDKDKSDNVWEKK